MKKFFVIFLIIGSTLAHANKTCLDVYKDAKWAKNSRASVVMNKAAPIGMVSAFPAGLTAFAIGVPAAPVGLALIGAGLAISGGAGLVILIHDSKLNKMVRLINQSYEYAREGGEAGKLLRRLKEASHSNLTLLELAESIIKENEEMTLCTGELETFRSLKKQLH